MRLDPTTRMIYGIAVAGESFFEKDAIRADAYRNHLPVFAVSGMYISDKLRTQMPVPSDDKTSDQKGKEKPALFSISVVDRKT